MIRECKAHSNMTARSLTRRRHHREEIEKKAENSFLETSHFDDKL
jgi:hypothetical protein